MITRKLSAVVWIFTIVAVFSVNAPEALADTAEITSVQVAPDFSHISIHSNGPLGKHSAFVIDRPYRLVIDFESTAIGNTKSKVRVDRGPLIEIRLGYNKGRARVVIDFGEHPVPPFNIDRKGDAFVVSLGQTHLIPEERGASRQEPSLKKQPHRSPEMPAQAVKSLSKPTTAPQPKAEPESHPASLSRFQQHGDDSAITVKDAGIKSNLVFVELVHKGDPRISYRLIVDLDIEDLNIRSASMSDAKGNLKKFQISKTETEKLTQSRSESGATTGPRRQSATGLTASAQVTSGITARPGAESPRLQTTPKNSTNGWPFKIEEFQPQPKTAVR